MRGDSIVEEAEAVLGAWHHISVTHGSIDRAERTRSRGALIDLAMRISEVRACEFSFKDGGILFTLGPPDGYAAVDEFMATIEALNSESWEIQHWTTFV